MGASAAAIAAVLPLGTGTVIPNFAHGDSCVRSNHGFCWSWFSSHWGDTFAPALRQHIVLTLIAVGIGFVLSLVLALSTYRWRWLELPVGGVAGLLYTIPSLALFELLVPFTGLHITTVEIALVSYTLLIIFRNVLAGLREVPADVLEAARGMGMTAGQRLWRVELPLAVPAMVAGVRVATVTVISLATVAAFVIDQGLGVPILNAIQQGQFKTKFYAASALAVALALLADALLVIAQRLLTPWARAQAS